MNQNQSRTAYQRWRRTASATALALVLATIAVLAYKDDGKPFTEVDLNDGGVWVTNQKMGLAARLNPQIKELDLGVDTASSEFDIFQRATHLFVDDTSAERTVKPVDVARAAVLDPTSLPTGAVVANSGETFAVVDPASGKAWVRSADAFRGFTVKSAPPDVKDALSAAVGTDGHAYVLGRDGTVTPFTINAGGAVPGDTFTLGGKNLGTDPSKVQLTVVGQTPVLFDKVSFELNRPGADPVVVETSDPTAVELQQPSDDSEDVYLATHEGLEVAPVRGGDLRKVNHGSVAGNPAAPVQMTSTHCVYAAWSDPQSPNNYLRDCADDAYDDRDPIDGMQPGASLQFRVNREVVVLNDVVTGDAWLVQEPGKAKIDNWPAVDPQNQNKSKLKETTDEVPDQENRPPEPQPDQFGARPGRTTVLPVVAFNDHDPDGDIISISKTKYVSGPELEVRIVGGGTQLQVAVPSDAKGVAKFRYYVTDGKVNEEVWAEVTLTIRDENQHAVPQPMPDRHPKLTVAKGATSSYFLLADFWDMDGDDLTLTEATAPGGDVEFRPDGTITFTDDGTGAPVSAIDFTIEDGLDKYNGKLPVDVVGAAAPPELIPDLASGVAGTSVVVQPLTNDRNPEGGDLTLKNVTVVGDDAGTTVVKDLDSGTFTFMAAKAKSYYLEYTAYNSSATAKSVVRLDIESPPKDNRPPIAVRDKAVVTPGGTAQVDLLLNDFDPDGDVLVVKRVGRSSIPGVKVSIVDKRLAIVSSATEIVGQQAVIEYTVSDGRSSTTGQLVVSQRQSDAANRHPIANKDQVTVRAGSVTTIPVLDNDSDPDGPKPRLIQSELQNDQDLDVWVSGDVLRLRAPDQAGTYSVIYGVRDADGLKASAEVSIYVIPDSAKNNRPPMPQPIIDRVIAGRPKVIGVDLVGADPDGDSVAFRSILTAPSLGRVLDTGVDWIRYEAFEGKAGTDFFQILVQDKYGATGVAEVRVGVAAAEKENQPPVALDDSVIVQPNRTISYNVLSNDVDPDDDPLRITSLNHGTAASYKNGLVTVDVGDAPEVGDAVTNVGYSIEDRAGAADQAVLKVTASRTAPFYSPVAHDDVAELGDIIGRDPGTWVDIPVLDNDLDFDGAKADLTILGCDAGARGECKVVDDKVVRVKLRAQDQMVLYKLDDADKESSPTFGVIYVTGTENVPPQLTTDKELIPVKGTAGEPVTFDLKDLVVTRAGREPSIKADSSVTAVNGSVTPVKGAPTSLTFSPSRDYVGAASVTVAVTDGSTSADDGALSSLLTIPVEILPADNVAPVMRDAAVDVMAGGDPVLVDLSGLTRDLNKGDMDTMTWSVKSAEDPLTATIKSDSVLAVEAGDADDGALRHVEVVADDGHGKTATGVVTARIVSNNQPLVRILPINVAGKLGESMSVDIADYAVNPFVGKPIEVSNPRIQTGRLKGLKAEGSTVSFTPSETGRIIIKATVSDATGDKKRQVIAQINLDVVDVPAAPERPVLSSVEASSAVLSWREPEANGAPIDEYRVRGSHGFEQTCVPTTCRLTSLTPGEAYTFTVEAHNSQGWGKTSPASEEIIPNKAPDLMTPPTIVVAPKPTGTRMDHQLEVRWTPPGNEGSAITSYEIKEAGSGHTWQASGGATSLTIGSLTNGTPYAFQIRAVNDVEPRREFSGPSKAVAPFGIPFKSGAAPVLTASEASDYTQAPWVRIEWSRWSDGQSNGSPVTGYEITCNGCNQSTYKVDGSQTSKTFDPGDGIEKGKTVSFTVAAVNDAGTSERSQSASGRPWSKAGPVRGLVEAATSPADRTATIAWDAPADNGGLPIRHYVVQSGAWSTTVVAAPGGGGTNIEFPDNGANGFRDVTVYAVTFNGDRAVAGETSTVKNVHTWGKPDEPTLVSSGPVGYYGVSFNLTPGNGNGQPTDKVEFSIDGGAHWDPFPYGGVTRPVNQGGDQLTVRARTISKAPDVDRRTSAEKVFTVSSNPRELDLKLSCTPNPLRSCSIVVQYKGFPQTGTAASVNLDGMTATSQCPDPLTLSATLSKTESGEWRIGDNNCRFTGAGSPSVTAGGLFDNNPN